MSVSRRRFLLFSVSALSAGSVLLTGEHNGDGTHNFPGGLRYNVKDYGAVGDGSTDDTAAIDAAITAAAASTTIPTVYFPKGTYMHDSAWHITTDDMRLLGDEAGAVVLKKRTNSDWFIDIDAERVTLENLTLDMNMTAFTTSDSALLEIFPGANDCHIHNCRFVDFGYYGVNANGHSSNISGTRITDSYFEVDYAAGTGPGNGVSFGADGSDWEVSGNTFVITGPDSGGVGVGMTTARKVQQRGRIANNAFTMTSGTGTGNRCPLSVVSLDTADLYPRDITIVGNTISCDTEMFGFTSFRMERSAVIGNVCQMRGTAATLGFELVDCNHVTCTGNSIDGGTAVPALIMLNNSNDCVVDGNILRNPGTGAEAIKVYADSQYTTNANRNVITNNKITISGTNTRAINLTPNDASANVDDTVVAHNVIDGDSNSRGIFVEVGAGSGARTLINGNNLSTLGYAFGLNNDTNTVLLNNQLSGIAATQRFQFNTGTGTEARGNNWQLARTGTNDHRPRLH